MAFAGLCALAAQAVAPDAYAMTVSIHAGPSVALTALPVPATHTPPQNLSPNFGFEAMNGIKGLFEAGFFYDQNLQISSAAAVLPATVTTGGGSLSFYGGIVRAGLPGLSSFFMDFQVGFARSAFEQLRSNTSLGVGGGLGYRNDLSPFFQLSPRVSYRWLPQTFVGGPSGQAVSYLDFDLLLSISI